MPLIHKKHISQSDQRGWPMKQTDDAAFLWDKIQNGARYVLVNDSSFFKIKGIENLPLKPIATPKAIVILAVA